MGELDSTSATPRRGALVLTALLGASLFGCDHATKAAAAAALPRGSAVPILGDAVVLRYVENDDIAFSLLGRLGMRPDGASATGLAAAAIAVLVVLAIAWWRGRRTATALTNVAFATAFAGALGNVVDRVARGYVVDFIHVKRWPVFNVADVLVVAGMALLVVAKRDERSTVRE